MSSFTSVFAHTDVTPPLDPPYWITAHGLYPFLPCKLVKFSNKSINLQNGFFIYVYSLSHIVQITDFLEFFHERCKEKSETCTKFLTSFVVTKNIEISF